MADQREFDSVEFVVSHLALELENATVRLEAYREVIAKKAAHLMFEVDKAEQSLVDSPLRLECIELRKQAVQAVRDSDYDALSESIAGLRGLAREKRNLGRFLPDGGSK
jgi:hypothetical protein